MTRSKIKTIVMVVAILLCLVLAGGWIAQTVIADKKSGDKVDNSAVFTVTPQNTASKMKITARTYFDDSVVSTYGNETYILTAETPHYSGSITWTMGLFALQLSAA